MLRLTPIRWARDIESPSNRRRHHTEHRLISFCAQRHEKTAYKRRHDNNRGAPHRAPSGAFLVCIVLSQLVEFCTDSRDFEGG